MSDQEVSYDPDAVIAGLSVELGMARADAHKLRSRLAKVTAMLDASEAALADVSHELEQLRDTQGRQEPGQTDASP